MANRLTKGKGLFGALHVTGATHVGGTFGATGAAAFPAGVTVGAGAVFKGVNFGTLLAVHGTVLPGGIGTVATALANLAAADIVAPNVLTPTAGLVLTGVKPAVGTLTTYLTNPTSGTISPGTFSMTYAHFDLT